MIEHSPLDELKGSYRDAARPVYIAPIGDKMGALVQIPDSQIRWASESFDGEVAHRMGFDSLS